MLLFVCLLLEICSGLMDTKKLNRRSKWTECSTGKFVSDFDSSDTVISASITSSVVQHLRGLKRWLNLYTNYEGDMTLKEQMYQAFYLSN